MDPLTEFSIYRKTSNTKILLMSIFRNKQTFAPDLTLLEVSNAIFDEGVTCLEK